MGEQGLYERTLRTASVGSKTRSARAFFNVDLFFGSMALRARLGLESGMQKFLDISQCLQEFSSPASKY